MCDVQKTKKYISRASPPYPANKCPEGLIKVGNDGLQYIAAMSKSRVKRWMKVSTKEPVDKLQMQAFKLAVILSIMSEKSWDPLTNFDKYDTNELKRSIRYFKETIQEYEEDGIRQPRPSQLKSEMKKWMDAKGL